MLGSPAKANRTLGLAVILICNSILVQCRIRKKMAMPLALAQVELCWRIMHVPRFGIDQPHGLWRDSVLARGEPR
jgi:hypothetical protein